SLRHERERALFALRDVRGEQDRLLAISIQQPDPLIALLLHDARVNGPVSGADERGAIAFENLPRGLQQRFDQVGTAKLPTDAREVGTDLAPLPCHLVTYHAFSDRGVQENLAAARRIAVVG